MRRHVGESIAPHDRFGSILPVSPLRQQIRTQPKTESKPRTAAGYPSAVFVRVGNTGSIVLFFSSRQPWNIAGADLYGSGLGFCLCLGLCYVERVWTRCREGVQRVSFGEAALVPDDDLAIPGPPCRRLVAGPRPPGSGRRTEAAKAVTRSICASCAAFAVEMTLKGSNQEPRPAHRRLYQRYRP